MRIIRDRPRSVDVDEFLTRPLFAHLATNALAGPRVSPVWSLWEDGAIWIIGNRRTDTFPSRVELDPRCAISIVDFDMMKGIVHHVGLRGTATILPFDAERAKRILRRYLDSDERHWDSKRFIDPLETPTMSLFDSSL